MDATRWTICDECNDDILKNESMKLGDLTLCTRCYRIATQQPGVNNSGRNNLPRESQTDADRPT